MRRVSRNLILNVVRLTYIVAPRMRRVSRNSDEWIREDATNGRASYEARE